MLKLLANSDMFIKVY